MSWEFALRGVLKALVLPPGIFVLLLLLAVLSWRTVLGRMLAVITAAGLYLLSTPFMAGWLAAGLETAPPADPAALRTQGAQAIVVLMAGRQTAAPETGGDTVSRLSMDRLLHAVRLQRATALPLIVSGGRAGADGPPLAELAAQVLRDDFGVTPLALETESNTTWENAHYLADLLRERAIAKVAVVTHAWHMPRALYSLEQAGVAAQPAPTYYIHRAPPREWRDWLPDAGSLANSANLLHEYLGLAWYRQQGRASN
jgi:uncharacterized SAM-binding protein YcdF (DUF218 family)